MKRQSYRSMWIGFLTAAGLASHVQAHEADQYTVPVGREFADLGTFFSDEMRTLIGRAVDKTNDRIRASLRDGQPTNETRRLQSPEVIAFAALFEFPPAIHYVESLELRLREFASGDPYPGLLIVYRPTFWIYHHPALLADVTKLARLGRSSTVMIDGVYLGTDKIVHFAHMGYLFFSDYRKAIEKGLNVTNAESEAINVGTNLNPFVSESTFLGMFTTGVWSNADLAADYCGLKFYRNFTEEVRIRGQMQPPMLVKDGPFWKLADHVVNTDFFRVFVSDHWDEALVPNVYGPGMAPFVEAGVRDRCDDVIGWYRNERGRPMTREQFRDKTASLTTYFGEPYGFRGNPDELVTIANVCFEDGSSSGRSNLISNPADRDGFGRTPLWWSAANGNMGDVQSLLGQGADPGAADADLETPLHAAARNGHTEIVNALLQKGGPINAKSIYGLTPLHLAVRGGHENTVAALLNQRVDVRAQDDFGCTPLHDAASLGEADLIRRLLDAGADPNSCDAHGTTPLHRAARSGAADAVSMLLANGANATARNKFGRTPVDEASLSGFSNIVNMLKKSNSKTVKTP